MLHGSTLSEFRYMDNNGLPEFLAENGYLIFDFCYFECPSNPNFDAWALNDYDIYKTYQALKWFTELKIFSGRVGLWGLSRGAEQASLLNEMIHEEHLPVQPVATALHSTISGVAAPFSWRWVADMTSIKRPNCWACKDGTESCFKVSLSPEDELWVRHMGYNASKSLFVWLPGVCGPDPRSLNLSEANTYKWKGKKIKNFYIWPKEFKGIDYDLGGHLITLTNYSGPYLILHGSKDEIWDISFSEENAKNLLDYQETNPGERPIISRRISKDGDVVEIPSLTSQEPKISTYTDKNLWHQFYILDGADHIFRKKEYAKIRKNLVKEFFDLHLSK